MVYKSIAVNTYKSITTYYFNMSNRGLNPEMRYREISKEMSSLNFGLHVFCQFEARVPEFDTQPLPRKSCGCTVYTQHWSLCQIPTGSGRIHLAQNTTTASLCWSHNTSSMHKNYFNPMSIEKKVCVQHIYILGKLDGPLSRGHKWTVDSFVIVV